MLRSVPVDRTAVRTSVIVSIAARTAARVQIYQAQASTEEPSDQEAPSDPPR